jgi:hypothetical protein
MIAEWVGRRFHRRQAGLERLLQAGWTIRADRKPAFDRHDSGLSLDPTNADVKGFMPPNPAFDLDVGIGSPGAVERFPGNQYPLVRLPDAKITPVRAETQRVVEHRLVEPAEIAFYADPAPPCRASYGNRRRA